MAGLMGGSGYGRAKFSYPITKDKITGIYKCTLCSYKSLHRSSVRSHYAVHSSARPYACDMCEYEAKRLTDLKKHKVLKHGKNLTSLRSVPRTGFPGPVKRHNVVEAHALEFQADDFTNFTEDQHLNNLDALLDYHNELGNQKADDESMESQISPVVFPEPQLHNGIGGPVITNNGGLQSTTDDGTVVVKPEPPEDYYNHTSIPTQGDDTLAVDCQTVEDNDESANENGDNDSSAPVSEKSCTSPSVSYILSETQTVSPSLDSVGNLFSACNKSSSLTRRNLSGSTMLKCSTPTSTRASPKVIPLSLDCQASTSTAKYDHNNTHNMMYNSLHSSHSQYPGQPVISTQTRKSWQCRHCDIVYYDGAMYVMHMGLHHNDNPWKCNLCGQVFHDVYGFTSHFVNGHISNHH